MNADDIPIAHTPEGNWSEMPPPVLSGCTEPLAPDAPDLRGTWRAVRVEVDGEQLVWLYGPAMTTWMERIDR